MRPDRSGYVRPMEARRTFEVPPRAGGPPDQLIRTISASGTLAVKVLSGSSLVSEALSRRTYGATAADALGRAMMGAVLIAVGSAPDDADDANVESVQLQFRGDGPLGSLTAIANSRGQVRGTVQHPELDRVRSDGRPDIAGAVGLGPLNVVRHRPRWRTPYTGTVPLVSGEIAGDLTLYLTESEQTPSAMGLGVAIGPGFEDVAACGFLVQGMPGATDEDLAQLEANVGGLPGLGSLLSEPFDPHALVDRLLIGLDSRDRYASTPRFHCPCSKERARRTLMLLDRAELEEMIAQDAAQEVVCDFCGQPYEVTAPEMASLLQHAEGA